MGKTIFVAIVAAILASVATTILLGSFGSPAERAAAARSDKQQAEIERLTETLDTLAKRQTAQGRDLKRVQGSRRGPPEAEAIAGPGSDAPAGEAAVAPDGTPYVSRADLETYFAEQAESLRPVPSEPVEFKPVPARSLEEIAAEMGLSIGEEAQVRIILRESEEEMMQILFGDRSIEEIKQEVEQAKDDPDKQAEMIQRVLPRVFTNIGNIATMEARQKKKLESVLGEERTAEFLKHEVEPIHGAEFEDLFDEF
jgi:hypothetical protein